MRWIVRPAVCWGAVAALVALLPLSALAHVDRDVGDGQYTMQVGFLNEPAYWGQQNGLELRVGAYGTGGVSPVEGLAATLNAEVSKDGETMALDLVPQEPGLYHAYFFPTELGDYTFRVWGEIEDASIDESFASSPTTFHPVEPLEAVQFPVQLASGPALEQRLSEAEDAAATARTLAMIGIGVGIIGLVAGAAGVGLSRRRVV